MHNEVPKEMVQMKKLRGMKDYFGLGWLGQWNRGEGL